MSGFQGTAMVANYAATKAYDTVLAEGLWYELRPTWRRRPRLRRGSHPHARATSVRHAIVRPTGGLKRSRWRPDEVTEQALHDLGRRPRVSVWAAAIAAPRVLLSRLLPTPNRRSRDGQQGDRAPLSLTTDASIGGFLAKDPRFGRK